MAGRWYLGVNGDDANTCKYTLSISKYSCPMNCSNRGVCMTAENNTRTCDCNKVGALDLKQYAQGAIRRRNGFACRLKRWQSSALRLMPQGYFGEDCSNEAVHLQYGVPMAKEAANFE